MQQNSFSFFIFYLSLPLGSTEGCPLWCQCSSWCQLDLAPTCHSGCWYACWVSHRTWPPGAPPTSPLSHPMAPANSTISGNMRNHYHISLWSSAVFMQGAFLSKYWYIPSTVINLISSSADHWSNQITFLYWLTVLITIWLADRKRRQCKEKKQRLCFKEQGFNKYD